MFLIDGITNVCIVLVGLSEVGIVMVIVGLVLIIATVANDKVRTSITLLLDCISEVCIVLVGLVIVDPVIIVGPVLE